MTPPARLLDLTRLIRRAGRVMTGVDRVEFAYLQALSAGSVPCWGLVRTRLGYVLLPPDALPEVAARLQGTLPWPAPTGLSRLARGHSPVQRAALTFIRSVATWRGVPALLGRKLSRQLPEGTDYFNIGHSNLTDRVLSAAKALGGRSHVFIHDVIPIDFPQYQRAETVRTFEAKLRRVQANADTVICNSADTAQRTAQIMGAWGDAPRIIVSHLGTNLTAPAPAEVPDGLIPPGPFFVTLGTIEPRKNHALLLDIWDRLGSGAPHLLILGARGWSNDAVFARLDARPDSTKIKEVAGLSDGAVADILRRANGLLFPSFAEGYGLPAVEAAANGVPVIASDLPVFREVLGNIPVYASPHDGYQWEKAIKARAQHRQTPPPFDPPSWEAHFKVVLTVP
ncbi:MAG: glycosyltransferase family 1 protein [Pseudomonadota bacterium]